MEQDWVRQQLAEAPFLYVPLPNLLRTLPAEMKFLYTSCIQSVAECRAPRICRDLYTICTQPVARSILGKNWIAYTYR